MRTEEQKRFAAASRAYRDEVGGKLSLHLSTGGEWLSGPEEHAFLLREIGTPEELDEQVRCALHLLKNVHRAFLEPEEERQVCDALAILGRRLEELVDLSAESEWDVETSGWCYNRQRRRLEEKQKGRGRPKQYVNREIVALFEKFGSEYKDETGKENSQAVREAIRRSMEHRYPPEMLTTERGGAIWRAINEYLYRGYR